MNTTSNTRDLRKATRRHRALGAPTRGKTNPNRLRRVDRWLIGTPWANRALLGDVDPVVVDLGYGATPVTTVELFNRLREVQPQVHVVGLELDEERVANGARVAAPPRLEFRRGGFELAEFAAGTRGFAGPQLVRALNVLRQYSETEAWRTWQALCSRLAPSGLLVEGTCDEIGRRCSWVTLDRSGPRTLTLACLPADLEKPSDLAERLPKTLIHRNVPGQPVHTMLADLDLCWAMAAPMAPFGPRARWTRAVELFAARGWPVRDRRRRWRLGELTVAWSAVAP